MPEKIGPNTGLSYGWDEGESGWAPGMDKNLTRIDAYLTLEVVSADASTPPGSPSEGDRYIVAATATGAWAGQENSIAVYLESTWTFHAPTVALRAFLRVENVEARWDGTRWLRGEQIARMVDSVGDMQGLVVPTVAPQGIALVRTTDGLYDPANGAIAISDGRLQAHGAVVELPGLTHSEPGGLPLYVSDSGQLFLGQKPPNLWEQSVTDPTDYLGLGSGTGTGAWVELTGMEITLGQNIETGHDMLTVVTLYIQEQSGSRAGTVEVHLDAAGAAPGGGAAVHATYIVQGGQDGLATQSVVWTATAQLLSGTGLAVYARINNGEHGQYQPHLLGSLGPHVHDEKRVG